MCGREDVWEGGCVGGWMCGRVHVWVRMWVGARINRWVGGWMGGIVVVVVGCVCIQA
jgi:hypothetical protein